MITGVYDMYAVLLQHMYMKKVKVCTVGALLPIFGLNSGIYLYCMKDDHGNIISIILVIIL